jgi:hypothetical protein
MSPSPPGSPSLRRRAGVVVLGVAAASALVPLGVSAAADAPAGSVATPRALKAGKCARHYASARDLTAKQRLVSRTPAGAPADGIATQPVISRDSRRNRYLVYVSTTTGTAGLVTPGRRNVYALQRTGKMTRLANKWKPGKTRLLSDGLGGAPADGDSFSPSVGGYTGRKDRPKGPRQVAFLSTSTNLAPGGNPTGTSAFVTGTTGGPTRRIDVPGAATSVAISGDSEVVYVATERGLYVEDEGKRRRLLLAPGISNVTTTLNGRQASFERSGYIYVVNLKGGVKGVAAGHDPVADGGVPDGGPRLGFIRAIAFQNGTGAVRAALDGKRRNLQRMGTSTGSSVAINVGGSAVAFGNRNHACLEVSLLDATHRRGGYSIPQGACPAGQGNVADLTVSSRYNYLAFTCTGGGLFLHYVGPK